MSGAGPPPPGGDASATAPALRHRRDGGGRLLRHHLVDDDADQERRRARRRRARRFARSRAGAGRPATGRPHRWQKRAWGESSARQPSHWRGTRLAPQLLQKWPVAGEPQAGQWSGVERSSWRQKRNGMIRPGKHLTLDGVPRFLSVAEPPGPTGSSAYPTPETMAWRRPKRARPARPSVPASPGSPPTWPGPARTTSSS